MRAPIGDVLHRPVQFFTGKGGVGKSTVIASVALEAARAGAQPLIVELGVHTSSSHLFHRPAVGYDPVEVVEGVYATRVLFEPALVDYVASRLKLRTVAKLVAKNNALRRLFMAAPGVDEIVRLHRVAELGENPEWAPVLVDLESTGHALMFFDLPDVLDSFLEDGPLRQVVDTATRLLNDSERCAVHIVTVPEPLAVRETVALHKALDARETLPLGCLFINRIPLQWHTEEQLRSIRRYLEEAGDDDPHRPRLLLADYAARRRDTAEKCIHGLERDIDLPSLHFEARDAQSEDIVEAIAAQLEKGLGR